MIRAVFDTNILASGAVAAGRSIALLIDTWQRGLVEVVVSSHTLDELRSALSASVSCPVTGDVELRQLGRYQAVAIIPPRQFLELWCLEVDQTSRLRS